MSRYTVVWTCDAVDELIDLWVSSADRRAVTLAVNAVDHELAENAATQGVEMRESLRALFVPPLKILFAVREDDRMVEVLLVRRT